MSERDSARSITIDIPQPRTFVQESVSDLKKIIPKKALKNRTVRKLSNHTLSNFLIPNNRPLHVDAIKQDDVLLSYKLYTKKQEQVSYNRRLKIKLHEKYKIITSDLHSRVHVEDPPDDVKAVTDIDDGFFRYLNGHSITQHIPLYKSLKFQFHNRLRTRQEVGYRRDSVLNIEENHRKELQAFEYSVQVYMDQVRQLDAFISEDYQKSMACLKRCEEVLAMVNAKVSQRENLANEQFKIESRLIGLDYMYFMQQKYGRFLYYLSPPSWRARHREFAQSVEIEAKGFDLGTSCEEDTFNVIFEKMQNECRTGLSQPVLYFSHPNILTSMFESLEKQQLHHFTHLAHLAPRKRTLKESIFDIKSKIEHDTKWVAHTIKDFVNLVKFCEDRESQLQAKFMKILNGLFYNCVASTDVLKLQTHLEFFYEQLYGEQTSIISLVSTARTLEQLYMEYSFQLDNIATNNKIKSAVKKYNEIEKKKMKRAHLAARELRLFDRLEHSLLLAHEKVNLNRVKTRKKDPSPVVKRSLLHKPKPNISRKSVTRGSIQRELTEAEMEYLHLFTDWTVNENPAKYLKSLSITDKINVIQ